MKEFVLPDYKTSNKGVIRDPLPPVFPGLMNGDGKKDNHKNGKEEVKEVKKMLKAKI